MNLHSFEDARNEIMDGMDVRDEKLHSRINKADLSVRLWRRNLRFAGASVVQSILLLKDGEKILLNRKRRGLLLHQQGPRTHFSPVPSSSSEEAGFQRDGTENGVLQSDVSPHAPIHA